MSEHRMALRTRRNWEISVPQEAHAIRECEFHGWSVDRADSHARLHPPAELSPDAAVKELQEVLDSIGDTCPECPPN